MKMFLITLLFIPLLCQAQVRFAAIGDYGYYTMNGGAADLVIIDNNSAHSVIVLRP